MNAAVRVDAPLAEVVGLLHVQLSTCYTLRWRGQWPWLTKRGRVLFVDLPAAAAYWDARGRRHVAAQLRRRAAEVQALLHEQRALAATLGEEADGQ